MGRIRTTLKRIDQPGNDARRRRELDEDLQRDLDELKGFEAAAKPYAGMARQVIKRFMREIKR